MTIWTKRTIYIFCLLIFFILAPLIILYTQGYRYNQAKEKIEPTGVFYIKSYPRSAKIYLNGVDTKKTTPDRLNHLLSSFYDIQVSQDGYFPWTKNLFLPSQQTIFIEDVALFKAEPKNIFQETTSLPDLIASTDHQAVFWKKINGQLKLWLLDTQAEKTRQLTTWTKSLIPPQITWSTNNQRILLTATNSLPVIIKIDGGNQLAFNELTKLNPEKLKWDDQNDNLLYFTNQKKLYQLDLFSKKTELIMVSSTQTFAPNKGSMWYLTQVENTLILKQWKSRTKENKDWLILPNLPGWQLTTYNNIIICYNKNNQLAYLLEEISDPQLKQPVITVLKNFNSFHWYGSKLLYGDLNQISLFDVNTKINKLLIRSADPISNFFWHPNGAYYLRNQNNQLVITELDDRGQSNSYKYDFAPIDQRDVIFNKKGERLFVIHKVKDSLRLSGFEMQ
jgi:hypothetical protein